MTAKDEKEWIKQAEDDLKSADVLLNGGRYAHCVFFCHLAVEKSLKAMYYLKLKQEPPKTHNLNVLIKETAIFPSEEMSKLLDILAMASVPTRYPQDLRSISKEYTRSKTAEILKDSHGWVKWIKGLLKG